MTDEKPVSEEALILASIVGAAFAGIATQIKNRGPRPDPAIKAMLDNGLAAIDKNMAVLGTPEQKAALIAVFKKAARI